MLIKHIIQFSTRNSILRIYWQILLSTKARLINFGLIQLSAIPGMKWVYLIYGMDWWNVLMEWNIS